MESKFLIGITKSNTLIFGNVNITYRNGYREFTASFDEVEPFINEESDGIEYFENLLDDCYSIEDKYKACECYDCKPSELAKVLAEAENIGTLADEKDCSLYTNRIYADGNEYAFESVGCGQIDIYHQIDIEEFVNEKAFKIIYKFWEEKHLKEITDKEEQEIIKTLKKLKLTPQEEEAKIAEYIEKYL